MAEPTQSMLYILQGARKQKYIVDERLLDLAPTLSHLIKEKRAVFDSSGGGCSYSIESPHAVLKGEGRILATLLERSSLHILISLPEAKDDALGKVIDYCNFKLSDAARDEDKVTDFESSFLTAEDDKEPDISCITSIGTLAYHLNVKALVGLCSRTLQSILVDKGTAPGLEAMVRAAKDDQQQSNQAETATPVAEHTLSEGQNQQSDTAIDQRSVDELVNYIGSIQQQPAVQKPDKKRAKKKKSRRRSRKPEAEQEADADNSTAVDPRLADQEGETAASDDSDPLPSRASRQHWAQAREAEGERHGSATYAQGAGLEQDMGVPADDYHHRGRLNEGRSSGVQMASNYQPIQLDEIKKRQEEKRARDADKLAKTNLDEIAWHEEADLVDVARSEEWTSFEQLLADFQNETGQTDLL